ncbi:hypothetical protein AC578_2643 [Pseudocercospora eumusae]|uniref:Uncharacterized protein n=1 Tax=Pseudocercospora eumusae TaxID=321146 RepID=A0A139H0B0_9PEZI|nr:hypothetical protein AC578_2643 [Pseudocercospora eumusae]
MNGLCDLWTSIPSASTAHIEVKCGRYITIAADLSEGNLAKCHPQQQSPLFRLPPELRTLIWEYVSEPVFEQNISKPKLEFREHPDLCGRRKLHTSFLLVCRRLWLEANHMPISNAKLVTRITHVDSQSRPSWNRDHLYAWMTLLMMNGLPQVTHVMEALDSHGLPPGVFKELPPWPSHCRIIYLPKLRGSTPPYGFSNAMRSMLNSEAGSQACKIEFCLEEPASHAAYFRLLLPRLKRAVTSKEVGDQGEAVIANWEVENPQCWNGPERTWTRYVTDPTTHVTTPQAYHTYRFAFKRRGLAVSPKRVYQSEDLRFLRRIAEALVRFDQGNGTSDLIQAMLESQKPTEQESPIESHNARHEIIEYWNHRWRTENSLLRFAE